MGQVQHSSVDVEHAWARHAAIVINVEMLAVPVRISTSDARVAAQAEALCRAGRAGVEACDGPPLVVDVEVLPTPSAVGAVHIRAEPSRLELLGDGVRGWADPVSGRAGCILSESWIERGAFGAEILEPLLLFLLSHRDRTPLHAAAFLIDEGLAVVAAGPSGSGKSCLAYAAQRAGLPLLTDDIVHVQLRPALRLWGLRRPLHVYANDVAPGDTGPARVRGGRTKIAIASLADRPSQATRAVYCQIRRGRTVAIDLDRAPPASLSMAPLEPGFNLLPRASTAACAALAANGHARLTLGADPAEAIAMLLSRRAELARIATD